MAYLGEEPKFGSFASETFSGNGSATSFTLTHGAASPSSLLVTIDGVKQQTTAYTITDTSLDFGSGNAPAAGTNNIEVVYLGTKTLVGAVADGAITTSKIAANAVTGAKIAMGSDAAGDILTYTGTDYVRLPKGTANQALLMNGAANAVTWGTAASNTPYWHIYLSADQSISAATWTKCQFNTEIYDSASEYDNSTNYRYVFGTAGTYLIYSSMNLANDNAVTDRVRGAIYKNGAVITGFAYGGGNYQTTSDSILHNKITTWPIFSILTVAASDYIEIFGYINSYGTANLKIHADSFFGGFKLA